MKTLLLFLLLSCPVLARELYIGNVTAAPVLARVCSSGDTSTYMTVSVPAGSSVGPFTVPNDADFEIRSSIITYTAVAPPAVGYNSSFTNSVVFPTTFAGGQAPVYARAQYTSTGGTLFNVVASSNTQDSSSAQQWEAFWACFAAGCSMSVVVSVFALAFRIPKEV